MALITCSKCGAKVSDHARYCIRCKTPTTPEICEMEAPKPAPLVSAPVSKRKAKTRKARQARLIQFIFGLIASFLILMVLITIGFFIANIVATFS